MKKITRNMLMLTVVALMAGLFTGSSCDKSTKSKTDALVGTWDFVSMTMFDTLLGDIALTKSLLEYEQFSMVVKNDGTITITSKEKGKALKVETGNWKIVNDTVVINGAGVNQTVKYKISGKTLTISMVMKEDLNKDGVKEEIKVDMIWTKIS